MSDLLDRVRAGGLLAPGRPVLVLLSGGRDSVCLLDLAVRIAGRRAGHGAPLQLRAARGGGRRRRVLRRAVRAARRPAARPPAGARRRQPAGVGARRPLRRGARARGGRRRRGPHRVRPGRDRALPARGLARPARAARDARARRAARPAAARRHARGDRGPLPRPRARLASRTRATPTRPSRAGACATRCCRRCARSIPRPRPTCCARSRCCATRRPCSTRSWAPRSPPPAIRRARRAARAPARAAAARRPAARGRRPGDRAPHGRDPRAARGRRARRRRRPARGDPRRRAAVRREPGRAAPRPRRMPGVLRDSDIGEILVQADDLQHRVRQLGADITRDYEGRDLLLIGVLKGAVFFLADLMREIECPCEVDFMAVASYGSATESSGVVRILKDLDTPIEGRDVLIVEDIVDSGLTLQYLLRTLEARGPASLEVCALLTKPERRTVDLPTRYIGFEIPDKFAIGYGLDHAERFRNLPVRRRVICHIGGGPHWPASVRDDTLSAAGVHSAGRATHPLIPLSAHEPVLQERRLPDPDRDRAGVLRLEADLGPGPGEARDVLRVPHAARPRRGPRRHAADEGQLDRGHARPVGQERVHGRLPARLRRGAGQQPAHGRGREPARRLRREALAVQRDREPAHVHPPVHHLHRVLDLPDEPGPRRRIEGHVVRQVARQADVGRLAQDHLPRRRRRRRGGRGAARDQGVPREPEEVPGARRADPQGRAALRASGHRQDAARARRRRRGRRAVLLDLRLGLRRDVRRRRRLARARPLRAGEAELALHHLHGRDRRRRPSPRRRHGRRARRARADAQPAARRDGRLRGQGQHHHDRGHQPARHPRSRPAAPRPLRPPDHRRPARPQGPREDPRGPHARQAARARTSTSTRSPARRPASPAPTSPTSSTRPRSSPPARARRRSRRPSSKRASCASSPARRRRPGSWARRSG